MIVLMSNFGLRISIQDADLNIGNKNPLVIIYKEKNNDNKLR